MEMQENGWVYLTSHPKDYEPLIITLQISVCIKEIEPQTLVSA